MDIKDIRRANLRRLIAGVGSVKKLAEQSDTNPDWLSALASDRPPTTPAGSPRGVGNKLARKLEMGAGKPQGWMDHVHDLSEEQIMWVDRFSELPSELQEKALEYLDLLYKSAEHQKEEQDTKPKPTPRSEKRESP